VARHVDTSGPGGTVIAFNPSAQARRPYVEYEPWTGWQSWAEGEWGLVDDCGAAVPYQQVETHEALTSARGGLTRLVFRAELPPLGYRVYRFAPGAPQVAPPTRCRATTDGLENDRIVVGLDAQTGCAASCIDRATGCQYVGPGGWNLPVVMEDLSDTWSHGIRRFEEAGSGIVGEFGSPDIRVVDDGPLQASVLVERSYGASTWLQQLVVRLGDPALLIRNWLFWSGRWRAVKLAFDVATAEPTATHDVPFGRIERPCDGAEVPTQLWFDVSGPSSRDADRTVGLAVADDGKYGCDVTGSTLRLTVLRSPPYAYHVPHTPTAKARYDWIDQGMQAFNLLLIPHLGDWRTCDVVQRARELNSPPLLVTSHSHGGTLPRAASLGSLSADTVELTALKPAADGDGQVIRVADATGSGTEAELDWQGARFRISLGPGEVATYRLGRRGARWECIECDMLERPLSDGNS
jgi:alpha-mannosidase